MGIFSFSKAQQIDSMMFRERGYADIDRLAGYLKILSSNYGLFLANIGSYVITVPFLLRWLGPEQYGIWLIFLHVVNFVSFAITWIAAPIAREAATCYVEEDRQRTQKLFQTVSVYYAFLGTAIVVFSVLGSPWVPMLFEVPAEIKADAATALMLLSAYIAGAIQLNLLASLLTGFQHMHIANLLLGARVPLGAGLGIGAVAAGGGLAGFAAGQVLATVIMCGIGWSMTRRITGICLGIGNFDRNLICRLIRSGVAYVGYSISYLMLHSDILLIGFVLGATPAAIYGIGYKVMDYAVQLIWKIPDSLFPMITVLDASRGREKLQQLHRLSGAVAMAVALLVGIIVALYGHASVLFWVGIDNTASPKLFVAFGVISVLQVLVHCSLMISYGTNRMSPVARISLIEGALKILIAIVLLHRLGMLGVALATILAQLCVTVWYIPLNACKITGDSLRAYALRIFVPTLPAAVTTALLGTIALLVVQDIGHQLLISLPISIVTYLLIYISQGLGAEERRWMVGGMRRVLRI